MSLTYAFRMHVSRVEANQPPLAQKKISPRSMTAVNEVWGAWKPHWCRKWKYCLERQSNFFEKLRKHNGELGLNIGKIRDNANEYIVTRKSMGMIATLWGKVRVLQACIY